MWLRSRCRDDGVSSGGERSGSSRPKNMFVDYEGDVLEEDHLRKESFSGLHYFTLGPFEFVILLHMIVFKLKPSGLRSGLRSGFRSGLRSCLWYGLRFGLRSGHRSGLRSQVSGLWSQVSQFWSQVSSGFRFRSGLWSQTMESQSKSSWMSSVVSSRRTWKCAGPRGWGGFRLW